MSEVISDRHRRSPILTARSHPSWGESVFRLVPEGRPRRRPSDMVRVATSMFLVAVFAAFASRAGQLEQTVYDLLNQIPSGVSGAFRTLDTVLLAAGAATVGLAVATRRMRLGGTIVAAGLLSYGVATALTSTLDVAASRATAGFVSAQGTIPDYPSVRLAAAVAALLGAAPYLSRPARRLVKLLIGLGALGTLFMLQGFPTDVLGAIVLGWGCAAAAHLAFGSPDGTPTLGDVRRALRDLGVEADRIELDPDQTWGATRFSAVDEAGRTLAIELIGRDATDAQLLASLWRSIWYKDSGGAQTMTRQQRVEHEAYRLLMADRARVPVPEVVAAGSSGGEDDAALVTRLPSGRTFAELDADDLTDDHLRSAWESLGRLHAARMSHGDLCRQHLVRTHHHGEIALLDLGRSMAGASEQRQTLDNLAMLVALAAAVGADRAVASAAEALGDERLEALLPVLQPSALGAATRHRPPDAKALLSDLRTTVIERTGAEEPGVTELRRVNPAQILMALATLLGIYLLASQLLSIDDLWGTLTSADPAWVLAVIVFSQSTQVTSAITVLGAVDAPLPFGRVVMLQFANGFTGLIGGTVANTALIVRFFQKQGLGPAVAVSSGVLWSVASFVMQVLLVGICLLIARPDIGAVTSDNGSGVSSSSLLYILGLGALVGVVFAVPRARRLIVDKAKPQISEVLTNLKGVAGKPRKAAQLFGGALGTQILFALSLDSAVHAYGGTVSFAAVVLTNSFASMVGGLAPVPGGLGVTEAGMIAGLTAAGVPQETAVAATLLHRCFTFYLPPIWGWFALRWLRQHDDL